MNFQIANIVAKSENSIFRVVDNLVKLFANNVFDTC